MVDDMIKAQSTNATHYTEGWFYLPNRGWIWTNHSSYPYFYDAEDRIGCTFNRVKRSPDFTGQDEDLGKDRIILPNLPHLIRLKWLR